MSDFGDELALGAIDQLALGAIDQLALGAIDQPVVEQYWQGFVSADLVPSGAVVAEVFQFGDSAELADRLLALVVDGPRRATASCRLDDADEARATALATTGCGCMPSTSSARSVRSGRSSATVCPWCSNDSRSWIKEWAGSRKRPGSIAGVGPPGSAAVRSDVSLFR